MWLLVVVALSNNPNLDLAKGSLQIRFGSHEECLQAKEKFNQLKGFNYRISASCTFRGNN